MKKITVLFVDDEEDFRLISIMYIKRILKDYEFEFFEASNGEEALELLKKGIKPSIIILDYMMPRINGIELLRKIDSDHNDMSDVPRIMISGYDRDDIKSEAERLRFKYIMKTVDIKIFTQKICQYMVVKFGFSNP